MEDQPKAWEWGVVLVVLHTVLVMGAYSLRKDAEYPPLFIVLIILDYPVTLLLQNKKDWTIRGAANAYFFLGGLQYFLIGYVSFYIYNFFKKPTKSSPR